MDPANFDQSNLVLNAPPASPEVGPLNVYRGIHDDKPWVISCWKPTQEELDEIVRTGRVWVAVMGVTMQPMSVMGISPFPKGV